MIWCGLQVQRESQVYESTLQKMNQQLQASLDLMAGEKAALQLSLTGLQEQFEGVAQAVYTADEAVVGQTPCPALVCHVMLLLWVRHPDQPLSVTSCSCCRSDTLFSPCLSHHAPAVGQTLRSALVCHIMHLL